MSREQRETPFEWSQSQTSSTRPPPESEREIKHEDIPLPFRREITYTPKLRLKLTQLCVANQDWYLEMSSVDDFFLFIRTQFAPIEGIELVVGDGPLLRQKVKTMVAEVEAAIAASKLQSGVAISATDLDQAVELVDRRKQE